MFQESAFNLISWLYLLNSDIRFIYWTIIEIRRRNHNWTFTFWFPLVPLSGASGLNIDTHYFLICSNQMSLPLLFSCQWLEFRMSVARTRTMGRGVNSPGLSLLSWPSERRRSLGDKKVGSPISPSPTLTRVRSPSCWLWAKFAPWL